MNRIDLEKILKIHILIGENLKCKLNLPMTQLETRHYKQLASARVHLVTSRRSVPYSFRHIL